MSEIYGCKYVAELMRYINEREEVFGMNFRWATPSEYFSDLHAVTSQRSTIFPVEAFDFQPYDDQPVK